MLSSIFLLMGNYLCLVMMLIGVDNDAIWRQIQIWGFSRFYHFCVIRSPNIPLHYGPFFVWSQYRLTRLRSELEKANNFARVRFDPEKCFGKMPY